MFVKTKLMQVEKKISIAYIWKHTMLCIVLQVTHLIFNNASYTKN